MGTITVQVSSPFSDVGLSARRIARLVEAVCRRLRLSRATISIAIVDNREIRRLNKKFLHRGGSTDCLSFDLSDPATGGMRQFEIIVSGEKAIRQSGLCGHSPQAELALYIVHGLLHNLGYDDGSACQAARMHDMEDAILRKAGFGAVYAAGRKSRGGN